MKKSIFFLLSVSSSGSGIGAMQITLQESGWAKSKSLEATKILSRVFWSRIKLSCLGRDLGPILQNNLKPLITDP